MSKIVEYTVTLHGEGDDSAMASTLDYLEQADIEEKLRKIGHELETIAETHLTGVRVEVES